MKIESCSHTNHQSGIKCRKKFRHEFFLLWRTQANPKYVGLSLTNHLLERRLFFRVKRTKRWLVSSNNLYPRKPLLQSGFQLFCNPVRASIKEMLPAMLRRSSEYLEHEVWS